MDFAREFGLAPNIIEKDYVLGWLLAGISHNAQLGASWAFKGGTCLKKCYFETYRFSEDLDFTLTESEHNDQGFLVNTFKEIANWIYDASGIEIPHERIRFDVYNNPRGKVSVEGRIYYKGPLRSGGDLPRVKLDLTDDEVLVLNTVSRKVFHPYPDTPDGGINVQCYCFEEVFAEKIRALAERLRPRDLYDVIHLYRHEGAIHNHDFILNTLRAKCEFKGIPLPTMEMLESKPERAELISEWENMLGHQMPVLPPFEQFWHELPDVFNWLYNAAEKAAPSVIPIGRQSVDTTWQPPAMVMAWHTSVPLEPIRFAAANHLCVQLNYVDAEGNWKRPIIEPYSLRRTKEGNLLLYAVKHETGEDRSYRVDRIKNADVTKTSFTPRYAIELTAAGPLSAQPTTRTSGTGGAISRHIKSTGTRQRSSTSNYGPKYIFQCTYCGKKFTHKSNDPSLQKHKDKYGYPCSGRRGFYVTTKY